MSMTSCDSSLGLNYTSLESNELPGHSLRETGEPTVLKLYPLAVSLKGARAGNGDRQVSTSHIRVKESVYCWYHMPCPDTVL